MAKMNFALKNNLTKEEQKIINEAPLVENKKNGKNRIRNIGVMLTQDEFDEFVGYINRTGLSRSFFIRRAIKNEMVRQETENNDDNKVWQDEPFLVPDAAKCWGVSEYRIRNAIRGNAGRPPKFRWDEVKRINQREFIVTRKGMNRLFGKQVAEPDYGDPIEDSMD